MFRFAANPRATISLRCPLALGALVVGLLAFVFSVPALSQTTRGTILGTVVDISGASIPGATVTVTDTLRGTTRTVTTNTAGAYNVPQLLSSTYTVKVTAKGFRTGVREGLKLDVGQTLSINFKMQPGAVTQTVTVAGSTPLINVTNAVVGGTLSNTIINNLPLNGRNFINLMQLRPGVTVYPGGGFQTQSTNGLPGVFVGYMLDGLQHTEPFQGQSTFNESNFAGDAATILPIDAIQTFRMMQNPSAQYGGFAGSIVNIALKSGTNHFHGDAYAFGRDSAWDARNYFNPVGQPVLPHSAEQYGATVGGPIIHNRLFFFVGYEGQKATVGNAWTAFIPVTGSLASVTPASVAATSCPFSKVGNCSNSIYDAEKDLTAGHIPLNPISLNLLNQYPANHTNSIAVPGGFPNINTSNNATAHVNFQLNQQNQLAFDMFLGDQTGNFVTAPPIVQPYFSTTVSMLVESMGVHWIWNPNPQWVNSLGFGYDRFRQGPIVPADENVPASHYGIDTGVTGLLSGGLPNIYVGSFTYLGADFVTPKVLGPNFIYDLNDVVSYVHGNNNFFFGGEVTHWIVRAARLANSRGKLKFNSLEDFLAGRPHVGVIQVGYALRRVNQWYYAAFFQDNWRAKPTLTINMGMRYNYTTPMWDNRGLIGNFDPNVGLIQQGVHGVGAVYNADKNNWSPRLGFAWNPHSGKTVVRGGASVMYNRIDLFALLSQLGPTNGLTTGLAAVPTGASCAPVATTCAPGGNINVAFEVLFHNALNYTSPTTPIFPPPPTNCLANPCAIMAVPRNFHSPAVVNWNLGVQRELTNSLALDVAYVGNHGRNLLTPIDINQVNPLSAAEAPPTTGNPNGCDHCEQNGRPYFNKYPFLQFVNMLGNTGISNYNALQVTLTQHTSHGLSFLAAYTYGHSLDNNINTGAGAPIGTQPQNSLDPGAAYASSLYDVRQRFTFSGTYALPGTRKFGQLLSGWQVNSVVTLMTGSPWNISDQGNDVSLTGEFNDRWNLYGSPKDFKITSNPFIYCTGSSTTVSSCAGLSASQASSDWSQCLSHAAGEPAGALVDGGLVGASSAVVRATGVNTLTTLGCYASNNGKSFIVPPAFGTFGTTGRNAFRGPGLYDWDASIFKSFTIKERLTAEFRAEVFNVFNHPTLSNPSTLSGSTVAPADPSAPGVFGCGCETADVSATNPLYGSGGNRGIQLGLKLMF